MRYLDRLQPLALLVLRVVLGVIMIGHGYGKVFGGFSHVHDMVQHIGFPGWTGGVLQYINQYPGGPPGFVARAEQLAERYGERFTPPPLLLAKAARGERFE